MSQFIHNLVIFTYLKWKLIGCLEIYKNNNNKKVKKSFN